MIKTRTLLLTILVMLVVMVYVALAADHAYIGNAKCAMCHKLAKGGQVWQVWEASAHAKAFEALNADNGETTNPKCLKCHTTGYGQGGYPPADTTINLKGVQCEECHGPASDYRLTHSRAETKEKAMTEGGLIEKPDEKTCLRCHNDENPNKPAEPWDFAKMWEKIKHGLPED
jgi:hypothetical protein